MDKTKYLTRFESSLRSAIDFWLNNSPDTEYGGISHCLDKDGNRFSLDKGVWMQGRAGWAFSCLYNKFEAREEYLEFARSCIDFAREKCTDTDGRMFVKVTKDGRPLEKSDEWFSEAFYTIACAEYYRATGEKRYLDEARRCYDLITELHSAPEPSQFGTRPLRHFNRPMILLNVGSVMALSDTERVGIYNAAARRYADEIRDFYKPEYHATLEAVAPDGSIIFDAATERVCCPGHDMECAWFLYEEGVRLCDEGMKELAISIFGGAYEMGYDEEYGGFIYQKDITGAPVEAYEQDIKVWWVHNEAIIASLMLYLGTGDEKYARIFEEQVEYAYSHFVDADGEWFATLRREGAPKETKIKGFIYKGPFHTLRMYLKCIEMLRGA